MAEQPTSSHLFAQALTRTIDLKTDPQGDPELEHLRTRLESQSKWVLQLARSHLIEPVLQVRAVSGAEASVEEAMGLRREYQYRMTLISKPVRVYFKRRNMK